MKAHPTALEGVIKLEPNLFHDARGYFYEAYHLKKFESLGIKWNIQQINQSYSRPKVVRGLHYQLGPAQAKLVRVLRGDILDVAVDLRRGSPNFGKHVKMTLRAEDHTHLLIPAGFAHGFYAFTEAEVLYLQSCLYDPSLERGVRWDDPSLSIDWPDQSPSLSDKDQSLPQLNEISPEDLPL